MSEDEEYSYDQSGEFDQPISHESSMLASMSSPSMRSLDLQNVEMSKKASILPIEQINEDLNEYNSDSDHQFNDHEANDMFFSCADWETQIKQTQACGENFSDSDLEEAIPFQNKR